MDLGTIKKRLDNGYYVSAAECLNDLKTMFANCFFYNIPNQDGSINEVFTAGKELEKSILLKLKDLPETEEDVDSLKKCKIYFIARHENFWVGCGIVSTNSFSILAATKGRPTKRRTSEDHALEEKEAVKKRGRSRRTSVGSSDHSAGSSKPKSTSTGV